MLLSVSFTAKFGLAFDLTLENAFFRGFVLKPTERAYILLKNGTRAFQNSPLFKRPSCFYVIISGSFEQFTLTLKQIFWKTKTFFTKLEYRFLAESTKTGNTLFRYKTVTSKANVKTNRMVSKTLTYHKERSFANNYFSFLKMLFHLRALYKELI